MRGDFLQILGCAYALHHTDHRRICSQYLNNCTWCQPPLWEFQSRGQCDGFNDTAVVPPQIGKVSRCAPTVKAASLSSSKGGSHWSEFVLCRLCLQRLASTGFTHSAAIMDSRPPLPPWHYTGTASALLCKTPG